MSQHQARIDAINKRIENPTSWIEKVYTGMDYLEKMLAEKPGNVMIVAGNNKKRMNAFKKLLTPESMFLSTNRR